MQGNPCSGQEPEGALIEKKKSQTAPKKIKLDAKQKVDKEKKRSSSRKSKVKMQIPCPRAFRNRAPGRSEKGKKGVGERGGIKKKKKIVIKNSNKRPVYEGKRPLTKKKKGF